MPQEEMGGIAYQGNETSKKLCNVTVSLFSYARGIPPSHKRTLSQPAQLHQDGKTHKPIVQNATV